METNPDKIITEQQVAINGLVYSYSVGTAAITNPLGNVIATLTEYTLTGNAGDVITLYRTEEGNWYEMKQSDSPFKNAIMMALKSAIDEKEKRRNS